MSFNPDSARQRGLRVINLDKLTYAGNLENLASLASDPDHLFVQGDIGNAELVQWLLGHYEPDAVVNFAAESHVDRSILDPEAFVRTNVLGTSTLLRVVKNWWAGLDAAKRASFRFLHISTDEVFGALQLALAYCWTNLVAAELLAADSGLGFLITMGGRLGRPDIIVLGMICVGISGAIIGFVIDQVEKKLLAGIRR